jgi:hypothetical protein
VTWLNNALLCGIFAIGSQSPMTDGRIDAVTTSESGGASTSGEPSQHTASKRRDETTAELAKGGRKEESFAKPAHTCISRHPPRSTHDSILVIDSTGSNRPVDPGNCEQ